MCGSLAIPKNKSSGLSGRERVDRAGKHREVTKARQQEAFSLPTPSLLRIERRSHTTRREENLKPDQPATRDRAPNCTDECGGSPRGLSVVRFVLPHSSNKTQIGKTKKRKTKTGRKVFPPRATLSKNQYFLTGSFLKMPPTSSLLFSPGSGATAAASALVPLLPVLFVLGAFLIPPGFFYFSPALK